MKYMSCSLISLLILSLLSAHALAVEPKENIHYTINDRSTKSSEIEVIEFFRYQCENCFYTEAFIDSWLTTKPDNVKFTRMPVLPRGNSWQYSHALRYAKAYHIADILDVLDTTHASIYKRIHHHKQHIQSDEELKQFFLSIGVTAKQYDSVEKGFQLASRMRKTRGAHKEYGITRLPAFVINGKYVTEYGTHNWPSRGEHSKSLSSKTIASEVTPGAVKSFEVLEKILNTLPFKP